MGGTRATRTESAVRRLAGSAWVRTLAGGLGLYLIVTIATVATDNLHLVPSLLMIGSLLVPVTFVVYAFEHVSIRADVVPAMASCFVVGGLVGTAAAAVLEYETLIDLGALPLLSVGLIEESTKLALPLVLFLRRRFLDPSAGVLFGIAAGMGFASFETMGYGLVELLQSRGNIGATEAVLAVRGVLSPAGHAAWTGLVCAALWRTRAEDAGTGALVWLAAAFLAAVCLHAIWDGTSSAAVHVADLMVSVGLLWWQLRAARRWGQRRAREAPAAPGGLSRA